MRELAAYAIDPTESGGRAHDEPTDPLREPFELDRHRIITCTAFRRLEHKTQVFAPDHHDHFRTRMTHTLEAAGIARTLAHGLNANDQLTEAIILAHDLGHPPFGHAGEAALHEAMSAHGGFNHNAHSLRVVEYLEHPFPLFRGLNLTHQTRAGLRTHATRYDRPSSGNDGAGDEPVVQPSASVEAQVASLADRIAYNGHDLEDAIGAEFIGYPDLDSIRLWREALDRCDLQSEKRSIHVVRRQVLDAMLQATLTDVLETSRPRLASITSPQQARSSPQPLVLVGPRYEQYLTQLEAFLLSRVYRHPEVGRMDAEGRRMIHGLFGAYRRNPEKLPPRFVARIEEQGSERVICDYLAGMTDRFCQAEFRRLCP
jgi:dGTPase